MLYEIRNAGHIPFKIGFVRRTGSKKGCIKRVTCIYGATPSPGTKRGGKSKNTGTRARRILKLIDTATDRPITPWISHIIEFNNKKVKHN